jgi:hypothetical protein
MSAIGRPAREHRSAAQHEGTLTSMSTMRAAVVVLLFGATGLCCAAEAPSTAVPVPAARAIKLVNADFESSLTPDGGIEGWEPTTHANQDGWVFALDNSMMHAGHASARIHRSSNDPWGMLHQTLPAAGLGGETLELSAWLRTDRADGEGAILVLRTLANGSVDKHVFMKPPVTGTRDWMRYSVRLAIPRNSIAVGIGVMMQGGGTLWLDDVTLVALPSR